MTERTPEESAEDLAWRLRLYRGVKEGAAFLRERLEERGLVWSPGSGVKREPVQDPQGKLL